METVGICVVGGGPAGSTLAAWLARLGHDVCLIESRKPGRAPTYETLTPGVLPLLASLGVGDRVARELIEERVPPTIVHWPGEVEPTDVAVEKPSGFLIERGRFDAVLLEEAQAAGVKTLRPAVALAPRREAGGGWRVPVRVSGRNTVLSASYLIDAAGRRSVLPRSSERVSEPTLALTARWGGNTARWAESRIEAGEDQWYWGIPLRDGSVSATVVLDPKRCATSGRLRLDALYRSLLHESVLLRGCLGGSMLGPVVARDATSRADRAPVGDGYVKVGDSAYCLDPLSSHGIQGALTTALHAGLTAHTLLARPAGAGVALEFYRQRVAEAVSNHRAWSSRYYSRAGVEKRGDFWRRRAVETASPAILPPPPPWSADLLVRVSERTRLADVPTAVGNTIVATPGIVHPSLDRPVAFLGGRPAAPFLKAVGDGSTPRSLIGAIARSVPADVAVEVVRWFWRHGILVQESAREDGMRRG